MVPICERFEVLVDGTGESNKPAQVRSQRSGADSVSMKVSISKIPLHS